MKVNINIASYYFVNKVRALNVRCVIRKVKIAALFILALLLLTVSLAIGLTVSRKTATPNSGKKLNIL